MRRKAELAQRVVGSPQFRHLTVTPGEQGAVLALFGQESEGARAAPQQQSRQGIFEQAQHQVQVGARFGEGMGQRDVNGVGDLERLGGGTHAHPGRHGHQHRETARRNRQERTQRARRRITRPQRKPRRPQGEHRAAQKTHLQDRATLHATFYASKRLSANQDNMSFQNLLVDDTELVRTITINRPAVLNALNAETLRELAAATAAENRPAHLRALILTGAGEKAFVAGADISEFNALSPEQARAYSAQGHALFDHLGSLEVPVIAAVNGFALGGGLELALACDFIYASDNARLGLVEVNLGIIPGFGGVGRLSRRVGKAMASELIFTATPV